MTLVRVEIQRLARAHKYGEWRARGYRWQVVLWEQWDETCCPVVEAGEFYRTAKEARRAAREHRKRIDSPRLNHGEEECPGCEDCQYDPDTDFGDPEEAFAPHRFDEEGDA